MDAPGWLASFSGTTGFRTVDANVSVGVGQILRNINVISSFGGEVRRGRFGILGHFLYLNAQAGAGAPSLVSKVDFGLQEFAGGLFASYRVIEGPRGWLDLLAGFRFTYLGEQVGLQANNMAIDAASTRLVDQFAQQLATPNSDLPTLINQNITDRLTALRGNNPKLPVAPIDGGQPGEIRNLANSAPYGNASISVKLPKRMGIICELVLHQMDRSVASSSIYSSLPCFGIVP